MQARNLVALLSASVFLAACNINVQAPPPPQQQGATIVSRTLESAAITPFASPVLATKPFASPASNGTPTVMVIPSPTGSFTPIASITPTGGKAMLSITGNSNCRSGPGGSFKYITAFIPGTKLEIVGYSAENNYWQVKMPNSTDTCWVWGQYATATGDIAHLPTPAPVYSVGTVPSRPGSLFYTYDCSYGSLTTELKWADNADNETGYRVYRFDQLLANLPPNATSYIDKQPVSPGTALQYSVEAYNDAGSSQRRTINFTCG